VFPGNHKRHRSPEAPISVNPTAQHHWYCRHKPDNRNRQALYHSIRSLRTFSVFIILDKPCLIYTFAVLTNFPTSAAFGLSTGFSIPPVSVPVQSRESSPARTPRLGGHAGSPNYDGTDSDSDKEDGPCKWCFGDYYPCRCAEKGRNTASMAQKSSPPQRFSSAGLKPHTFNRSRSVQLARLNAVKLPTDGVPCKWCLGTFVPCFCEEGLPGLEGDNVDQESSEYLEGYNNGRRSSKYIRAGSISEIRRQSLNNMEIHSRGASRNGSRKNSHVGHETRWREVYGENSGRIA
jgi:hypothetical protein